MTRVASGASFEVPAGFTNTGLCATPDGNLAIGDFTNGKIVFTDVYGNALSGDITLVTPPANSVQGVAWDSTRNEWWVCHYAASSGTISRYNASGVLQSTVSPGVATPGPNGCAYDAVNDRILAVYDDNHIRSYNCTTGAGVEDIIISATLATGATADGLAIDPADNAKLWLTFDVTLKIGAINRADGSFISSFDCAGSPESLAFIGGYLYSCNDRLYHESIALGNRVHRYNYSVGKPAAVWLP